MTGGRSGTALEGRQVETCAVQCRKWMRRLETGLADWLPAEAYVPIVRL